MTFSTSDTPLPLPEKPLNTVLLSPCVFADVINVRRRLFSALLLCDVRFHPWKADDSTLPGAIPARLRCVFFSLRAELAGKANLARLCCLTVERDSVIDMIHHTYCVNGSPSWQMSETLSHMGGNGGPPTAPLWLHTGLLTHSFFSYRPLSEA